MTFEKSTFQGRVWNNPKGAVLQVWRPSHWELWMFELETYSASNRTITFGKGGFQGARGNKDGAEWYINNVFEELDSANEFFYDVDNSKLYFFYNGTGYPPSDLEFVASNLKTLISIEGSQLNPAKNITIQGITIQNAAYTYMVFFFLQILFFS